MSKNKFKRITIKIGTRVLTGGDNSLDDNMVKNLVDQVVSLSDKGIEIVIVSSGAIGAGSGLLNLRKKQRSLSELQAMASVGQNHLMDVYNKYLKKKGFIAGQILLTQEDFNDRRRFLNIRYTINTLLKHKAVPIINENDSVSTEEIKCGDNDRLSYLVSDLASSELLIILTDVEGLYDNKGSLIEEIDEVTDDIKAFCRGKGCELSTGGMITKLEAVKNATRSGIECVIAKGDRKNVILDIFEGEKVGTRFEAATSKISARKRWIAYGIKPKGRVIVDSGAAKAVQESNKSLLPSGISGVEGKFSEGDVVDVVTGAGKLIARGITSYSSDEVRKIKGLKTDRIEAELGYKDYDEVIHRDNLAIIED